MSEEGEGKGAALVAFPRCENWHDNGLWVPMRWDVRLVLGILTIYGAVDAYFELSELACLLFERSGCSIGQRGLRKWITRLVSQVLAGARGHDYVVGGRRIIALQEVSSRVQSMSRLSAAYCSETIYNSFGSSFSSPPCLPSKLVSKLSNSSVKFSNAFQAQIPFTYSSPNLRSGLQLSS